MNHSGLARIHKTGFVLTDDLLRPMSIRDESSVWCVYCSPVESDRSKIDYLHDFMITPIPPPIWPYIVGIKIRLQHRPGALAAITSFLRDEQLNILTTHCSRSEHRYVTCNFMLDVEKLHSNHDIASVQVLEKTSKYLNKYLKALTTRLRVQLGDWLYADDTTDFGSIPVVSRVLSVLGYFYKMSLSAQAYQPFQATCKRGTITLDDYRREWLGSIVHQLPTLGFVEADTHQSRLRLVILPVDRLETFAEVAIYYSRDRVLGRRDRTAATVNEAAPDGGCLNMSTRGLQAEIYDRIKGSYTVWSAYSNSCHVDSNRQEGQINLMVESVCKDSSWPNTQQRLASTFKEVEDALARRMLYLSFKSVHITPLSATKIFISIKGKSTHRDDYVKWCREEGNEIGLSDSAFDLVESYTEATVSGMVADRLRACDGLLQFYMNIKSSDDARWLEVEYFAARVLNKPCVRIVDEKITEKKLPVIDKDQARIKVSDPNANTCLTRRWSKRTVRCAHAKWPGCVRRVTVSPTFGLRARRKRRGAHPTTCRYPTGVGRG